MPNAGLFFALGVMQSLGAVRHARKSGAVPMTRGRVWLVGAREAHREEAVRVLGYDARRGVVRLAGDDDTMSFESPIESWEIECPIADAASTHADFAVNTRPFSAGFRPNAIALVSPYALMATITVWIYALVFGPIPSLERVDGAPVLWAGCFAVATGALLALWDAGVVPVVGGLAICARRLRVVRTASVAACSVDFVTQELVLSLNGEARVPCRVTSWNLAALRGSRT